MLDRFCDAYPDRRGAARRAPALRLRGLADPHRPGLPAPDAHLPARRLPAGLRRQVPRVQRRLARRRRLHRHPLPGPAHDDRPPARAPGVRHRLHADPARADHARCARPTRTSAPPAPSLPETPRLALVDADGSPSVPEFRIICAAAKAAGIEADHATLEDVTYDGSTLHVKGEPVQLVYRRALLEDLDQSDLVAAARDGRVCLVNPFRSRVANNKKLFALFQDPRFAHLIDGDEADVIKATIPWTRILRPGRVNYGDWTIDLLSFVADNREKLVLKPASDFGGHGVSLGMETKQDEWEQIIAAHADRADYIVQEYVPVPEEMFPTVEDGHVQMRLKRFNINPFGIGGRYAGSITRISDRAVINVSAGGGLLPSVIGRHKRRLLAEDEDESEVLDGQKP